MDILKRYSSKVAKVIFANRMNKESFENASIKFRTYAFLVPKEMKLHPGDFVVVDCSGGLQVAIFHCYSNKIEDIEMAYKYIVAKVSDYSVYNYD